MIQTKQKYRYTVQTICKTKNGQQKHTESQNVTKTISHKATKLTMLKKTQLYNFTKNVMKHSHTECFTQCYKEHLQKESPNKSNENTKGKFVASQIRSLV